VEDDFRVAEIHRGFLERLASFSVVGIAHTAQDALERAERDRPDLVLLDIYLPDRSGLEVLRELHATGRPPVDVIAITAANDVETLRSALQGGVVHYLVKPFLFDTFRDRLERYAALLEAISSGRAPPTRAYPTRPPNLPSPSRERGRSSASAAPPPTPESKPANSPPSASVAASSYRRLPFSDCSKSRRPPRIGVRPTRRRPRVSPRSPAGSPSKAIVPLRIQHPPNGRPVSNGRDEQALARRTPERRVDGITELRAIWRHLDRTAGILAARVIDGHPIDPLELISVLDRAASDIGRAGRAIVTERARLRDRTAERELEIVAERRARDAERKAEQ